ncbi:PREDICTED: uncharacterized protein LOC105108914 [Populus euphratica]|uniref:Uncharacterized protein LOC105108914 n=1 Tax=Populus euphratica TaxID=75702 RepID=A0AAJ6T036_POPEU|nr:PREDICTED: uncharacterized protein LOC105108914 [Populus euphratica]XP_011001716.1 PREDICTED: uncharacterized protein LOC105108914 [Populus euphratica]
MGSETILKAPYRAAMNGKWDGMIDYYQKHSENLHFPLTASKETALHIAVCSKQEQPLKDLLEIMTTSELPLTETEFLKKTNKFGNTVLHEATIYGNNKAVKLLVERCPELLSVPNKFGETPLFTAAGFAETEIVEFLIRSKPGQRVDDDGLLLPIHRQRTVDNLSILSAAIIGQNFETALLLLELDRSLANLKDKNKISTLQLLAEMPAAFESAFPMGIFERLIHCCLPVPRHREIKSKEKSRSRAEKGVGDLESGLGRNPGDLGSVSKRNQRRGILKYLKVPKGCWLEGIWNQKKKRVFALRFAKSLAEKDDSYELEGEEGRDGKQTVLLSSQIITGDLNKEDEGQTSKITSEAKEIKNVQCPTAQTSLIKSSLTITAESPLFTATRRGIEKIVEMIIKQHPHAIEKLNKEGQSILDMAVMYRQKKIFHFLKQQKIPLTRMRRVVDSKGNTLLHHVAEKRKNSGVTKPGPALQLQEELQWFEQVQKVIPSNYVPLLNDEGKTARECFEIAHEKQLEKAQIWIKETSQSCSTVAALVATVVFAAAYTVPGGSDENGKPNFINSPYFLIFTVSDVVSLASSLTSLVVFLSLLTSPIELQDFHISLPRKLIVGFTFLFFSVITTMLSFGATILILIQSERKLTTLLLSIASFLPVLVFGIMQFRLYVSFMGSTLNILKIAWKAHSSSLVPCLPWGKKFLRED